MHPSIAQRITVLDGLRARARQATAEFYQKPGVQPPPLAPLIVVHPRGNNIFTLVNRATGVVVAERFGHNNATSHARELEAKAAKISVKHFGKILSNWILRISITLTTLAFFGSHIWGASTLQCSAACAKLNTNCRPAGLKRLARTKSAT